MLWTTPLYRLILSTSCVHPVRTRVMTIWLNVKKMDRKWSTVWENWPILFGRQEVPHKASFIKFNLTWYLSWYIAYYQWEVLYLADTGNLEGRYVYIKEIGLLDTYLKKCSSVLGYSYITTKSTVLLVLDKLDVRSLINPGGAYEVVRKEASTVCKGQGIIV